MPICPKIDLIDEIWSKWLKVIKIELIDFSSDA